MIGDIYLLNATNAAHKLVNQFIKVYGYSGDPIELQANGMALAYRRYGRLSKLIHGSSQQ